MKKLLTILIALTFMNVLMASSFIDHDKDGDNKTNSKKFEVTTNTTLENINITFVVNTTIENVKIIDSNSQVVIETGKNRGSIGSVISIPIENMESGTYFIRIETEDSVQIQRIIINL
jgi:hypothetical protein